MGEVLDWTVVCCLISFSCGVLVVIVWQALGLCSRKFDEYHEMKEYIAANGGFKESKYHVVTTADLNSDDKKKN